MLKTLLKKPPLVRVLLIILLGVGVWFCIHVAAMLYVGLNDNVKPADVIVVYGNTVHPDGTPSKRLQSRLDKAFELYNNKFSNYIVVSGAVGKEGVDEAAVMAEYLQGKGVPEKNIIVDSVGVNTAATVHGVMRLLRERDWYSVIMVSQYYHIPRILIASRQGNLGSVYHAHAAFFEWRDVYSVTREFIAFYKYLFLNSY